MSSTGLLLSDTRCLYQAGRLIDYHCIPWNPVFRSERVLFPSPLLSISPRTHLILWCLNALIWELVFPACFGRVSSVSSQAKSSKVQMFREWLGFGTQELEGLVRNSGTAHSSSPSLSQPSFCYCEMNLMLVHMSHKLKRSNEIMGRKYFSNFLNVCYQTQEQYSGRKGLTY